MSPRKRTRQAIPNFQRQVGIAGFSSYLLPHISLVVVSVTLVFGGLAVQEGKQFVNYEDEQNFEYNSCIKAVNSKNVDCILATEARGV